MEVKTRFLILSDTHGRRFPIYKEPVDVAIHCGDISDESKLDEFKTAIELLKEIKAPLKLVIAGNHDWTLDTLSFERKVAEALQSTITLEEIKQHYGEYGAARRLFEDEEAKAAGIVFLDEGTHQFALGNGALLTVYVSPYSLSLDDWGGLGDWGFQYNPQSGPEHEWDIKEGVDVVITHGPPEGIMDRTGGKRAGSRSLFASLAGARPKMHCFGHVHNNWGARLVAWRGEAPSENPLHITDVYNDPGLSPFIERLGPSMNDPEKLERYRWQGACITDQSGLGKGRQTLFVNAAIQGCTQEQRFHFPWVVDLALPRGPPPAGLRPVQSEFPPVSRRKCTPLL